MPVSFKDAAATAAIDLTRTMAPDVSGFDAHIRNGLRNVADLPDLSNIVQRHRFHGTEHDKAIAAKWLGRRVGAVPAVDRLLLTGGTQNILMILLPYLVPKGTVIAIEKLTYAAIGQLARLAGVEVVPVDLDGHGMRADSLEDLCKKHKVAAIYTNPTGHNPTTTTMPLERRRAIADIAKRYNIAILEDDVHGLITKDAPPPIASIIPDQTWYIMTTSKCIGIGLRAAYLIVPSEAKLSALMNQIPSVSAWFVPGISAALITHLIETGAADEIAQKITAEIGERQDIAQDVLGPLGLMHTNRSSLHIWVDLPPAWNVQDLIAAAAEKSVTLRHPKIFATGGFEIRNNVRMSMIAPPTQAELREGLQRMAGLLKSRI